MQDGGKPVVILHSTFTTITTTTTCFLLVDRDNTLVLSFSIF
jgi:hypothetical protein